MKRNEIISRLLEEGFSSKTLANFSDKQLASLSSRILSEQQPPATVTTGQKSTTVNVSSKNPNFNGIMTNLQRQNVKNINVTEEGKLSGLTAKKEVKETGVPGLKAKEVKESGVPGLKAKEVKESGVPGLKAKVVKETGVPGLKAKEVKESGVPGLKAKVVKETGVPGLKAKEVKESGVPGLKAKEVKESGVPGLKAKKMDMKEEGAMPGLTLKGKSTSTPTNKVSNEKDVNEEGDETKSEDGKQLTKRELFIKKMKNLKKGKKEGDKETEEKKDINEWVDNIAQKYYHPFTSKNDIMEMISSKMDESKSKLPKFLMAKSIKSSGGEVETMDAPAPAVPKTKPGTKPGTIPTPKTPPRKNPYKPGPGINPHPKALAENQPKVPVANPGKEVRTPKA